MTSVMGVVNVTPDSFSDGGLWYDHESAVDHAFELIGAGADIVDVGGESTRPGAESVSGAEEARRVLPVIKEIADRAPGVRISADTRKAEVAEAALDAGATILNDVSASLYRVAANAGAGWVAMHMRGEPSTMQSFTGYGDVVREVTDYLRATAEQAAEAGVKEVWVDPGIGFAKTFTQNRELLARLDELVATGWPVLVGTSRKGFLGELSAVPPGEPTPPDDRLEASVATAVWSALRGAAVVRVHDVPATVTAIRLLDPSLEVAA